MSNKLLYLCKFEDIQGCENINCYIEEIEYCIQMIQLKVQKVITNLHFPYEQRLIDKARQLACPI